MPDATVEPTAIFIVDVPFPVIEFGVKVTVTPVGCPEADSETAESKPPVTLLVMVLEPALPAVIEMEVGEAEMVNPAAGGPVSAVINVAVGLPQPVTRSNPETAE